MKFREAKDMLNPDGKGFFYVLDKHCNEISERKYGQLNYDNPEVRGIEYDDEGIATVVVDAEYSDWRVVHDEHREEKAELKDTERKYGKWVADSM